MNTLSATADLGRILERRRRWRYTPPSLLTYLVGAAATATRGCAGRITPADAVGVCIGATRGIVCDAHDMLDVLVDTQLQQIRAGTAEPGGRASVWLESVASFGPIPGDLLDVPVFVRAWPAGRELALEVSGQASEEVQQLFLDRLVAAVGR